MRGVWYKLINACGRALWPFYNWHIALGNSIAKFAFINSVEVGGGCDIKHPIYLHGNQYIKVGSEFVAGPGLRIEAWDAYASQRYCPIVTIGDRVVMNFNVHIGAIEEVRIGNDVLIGSNVLITDHSHGGSTPIDISLPPLGRKLLSKGPVVVDDNVWIGEGVCILPGVHIGRNVVIGANAVVTHDIGEGEIVGGVPAKTLASVSLRT